MIDTNRNEGNSKIAKNTAFLYLRMLFSMAINLYLSRAIINILGVDDYGIYNVVGGVVIMFTFLNNAMLTTTQRFLNYYMGKTENKDMLSKVFCSSINIHIFLSIIIIILSETIGLWFLENKMVIPPDRMEAARWVFQFTVISTVFLVLTSPFVAIVISSEKMNVFAYISMGEILFRLIAILFIPLINYDKLILYALILLIEQIIVSIIYIIYDKLHFLEVSDIFNWDSCMFKSMFSFVGWNFVGSAAYLSFTQGLNILLNLFFGPVINAARGISIQVQSVIQGFTSNFQMALNPQITKNYSAGNYERMYNLIYASCRYSFFLLYVLVLPVIFECTNILKLWLGVVPPHTENFVILVLTTLLIETASNPLSISAQATGKIKTYQLVLGGLQLSILPLSFIALKILNVPEIVYVIQFLVFIIAQIIRMIFIHNMIGLPLKTFIAKVYLSCLKVVPITICASFAIEFLIIPDKILYIILRTLLIIVTTTLSIFIFGLSKKERFLIINYIKKYISRFSE